jgi:hypothetical protein
MITILTDKFTGSRQIPGTIPGWSYELTIAAEPKTNQFTVSVTEIPGNPDNRRTKENVAYADAKGIFRWVSNDAVLSVANAKETFVARIPGFDATKQEAAYFEYSNAALVAVRKNDRPLTLEERFEMTAAFGFNRTVTNVLTGRRTRTLSRKAVR